MKPVKVVHDTVVAWNGRAKYAMADPVSSNIVAEAELAVPTTMVGSAPSILPVGLLSGAAWTPPTVVCAANVVMFSVVNYLNQVWLITMATHYASFPPPEACC